MLDVILKSEFPTFAIIFLGFFAGKLQLLGENADRALTKFVYYFSFPAILFEAMASEPINSSFNLPFIYAFAGSSFLVFFISFTGFLLFTKKGVLQANMNAFAASSANTAFMGIPILVALFGEKAVVPMAVATFILVSIMVIAIVIIEICQQPQSSLFDIFTKVSLRIVKNPIIMAPVIGFLFAATRLHLPVIVSDLLHLIGGAASPCALFVIGLLLVGCPLFTAKTEFAIIGGMKLIIQPLLMLILIFFFKVPPFWAACGFILSALPIAAVVYLTANQYQINVKRFTALTFESTLCSIITLAILILIAKHYWPEVFL